MTVITGQDKTRRTIIRSSVGIVAALITIFIGTKIYPMVHGPQIQMNSLKNGTTLQEPLVSLSGRAKYTDGLIINGNPVATSPDGSFKNNLLLSPGYNIITMQATDKFGSSTVKNYAIVLHENENGTFTANVPPYLGGI